MKRYALIFCIVLSYSIIASGQSHLKTHQKFTVDQFQQDFLILTTSLREAHPDLYRVISKEQLETKISAQQIRLKQCKTYLDFLKIVAELFTDIACINTQWSHAPGYIKFRNENIPIFPVKLEICDRQFFIGANYSSDSTIVPGDEILKINGEEVSLYLQKNYAILPIDGKVRGIQERWLENYFPQHHTNFWEQPATYKLALKSSGGKLYTKKVKAVLKNQLKKPSISSNEPFYAYTLKDKTGILTIRSFSETIEGDFLKYIDSCLTRAKYASMEELIIDMRGESEGSHELAAQLYSYLVDEPFRYFEVFKINEEPIYTYRKQVISARQKSEKIYALGQEQTPVNTFGGKLYILSDGWTNGEKAFFCAKLNKRSDTFFAGEGCGASSFGMNGLPLMLQLPNTGISVYIPTAQFITEKSNYKNLESFPVNYNYTGMAAQEWLGNLLRQVEKDKTDLRER